MHRITTTLIILSLCGLLAPVSYAAESVSEEYTGTAGAALLGRGTTPSWRPCPGGCDLDDDEVNPGPEIPDAIKFGGGPLFASQTYSNVIVSVNDDIFGSHAGTQVCFWNPEGETFNICEGGADGEDYLSPRTCGPVPLLGSPYPGDRVTVWVYTAMVTEDLDTCGGFSGIMTGDFF